MVLHNGQEYQDNDVIDWHTAVEVGGAYFHQAQALGLPMPPACFVFIDEELRTYSQSLIVGWYAALLHATRLDAALFRKNVKWQRAELSG